MILFEKFGQHQPLNREAERYARQGVPLSLSTLADEVGAGVAALMPLFKRLEAHVLAASRLHGDDTTVPVLAKGKTDAGRLWTYVRDYAHPMIMRSSSGQERVTIGHPNEFQLVNCA
ncbi:transposase [Mesorhizobium sp. M0615]|uniref:IS66 family transposase n=1 Tax=Mesorhizobium sp. M0615 TaxID=2956971 RepID=UPI00333A8EEA